MIMISLYVHYSGLSNSNIIITLPYEMPRYLGLQGDEGVDKVNYLVEFL
jgi:hypothetical protein